MQADTSKLGDNHRLEAGRLGAISEDTAQSVVTTDRAVEDVRRSGGCRIGRNRLAAGSGPGTDDFVLRIARNGEQWIKSTGIVRAGKCCSDLAVELIKFCAACKLKAVEKVVAFVEANLIHKGQAPVIASAGNLEDCATIAGIGCFDRWRRNEGWAQDRFAQVTADRNQAATARQDDATSAG